MRSFMARAALLSWAFALIWAVGCSQTSPSDSVSSEQAPIGKMAAAGVSGEPDESISLSAVPTGINDAVTKAVPGCTVLAAALGDENGMPIYELQVRTVNGQIREVKVDQKGTVLADESGDSSGSAGQEEALDTEAGKDQEDNDTEETENETEGSVVALSQVPQAVLGVVRKAYPDGTVLSAERDDEDGPTTYELRLKLKDGSVVEVETDQDGNVLETTDADQDDD